MVGVMRCSIAYVATVVALIADLFWIQIATSKACIQGTSPFGKSQTNSLGQHALIPIKGQNSRLKVSLIGAKFRQLIDVEFDVCPDAINDTYRARFIYAFNSVCVTYR